jgi:hypothetical protein
MSPFSIWSSIGPGEDNHPEDVKVLADGLASLGLDDALPSARTGAWGPALDRTTRRYQAISGLAVDGVVLPGGQTEQSLRSDLAEPPPAAPNSPASLQPARPQPNRPRPNRVGPESASSRLGARKENAPDAVSTASAPASGFGSLIDGASYTVPSPPWPAVRAGGLFGQAISAGQTARQPAERRPDDVPARSTLRYRPDPMGRVGEGDWVDGNGVPVSFVPDQNQMPAPVPPPDHDSGLTEQNKIISDAGMSPAGAAASLKPNDRATAQATRPAQSLELGAFLASRGFSIEQIINIMASPLGRDLKRAFSRIGAAAGADGRVPTAVLADERRRLGIEPEGRGPMAQLAEAGGPDAPVSRRWRFGAGAEPMARGIMEMWRWLTSDIKPLGEAKQGTLAQIDATVRALRAKREKPGIGFLDRWSIDTTIAQLQVQRSKIAVFFPSTPLDLAAAGISAIGVVQVGRRVIPLFRQGNKLFDADELATGAWQTVKPIERLDEISPAEWQFVLEEKYGKGNVVSSTIPSSDSHWFKLRNTQNPTTKIWYDERGFPIFDPVVKFDTRIPEAARMSTGRERHMRAATRQLWDAIQHGQVDPSQFNAIQLNEIRLGRAKIEGFTWHHHQEFGRMQLVPEDIHSKTRHIGSVGMRENK